MPYLEASAGDWQAAYSIRDVDRPDAAVIVGQLYAQPYFRRVLDRWPNAREVDEHTLLVEEGARCVWIVVVIGAAVAAMYAHVAAKLGAAAILQLGSMGGLADGWEVGDVLVPSAVVGRDGVSRQLARNRPVVPDPSLAGALRERIAPAIAPAAVRSGTLVTTTTINFERPIDVARWRRSGYAGVEMECAATGAVAAHFGVPFAGAFVLMDNLAVGHTVFAQSEGHRDRIRAGHRALLDAAVCIAAEAAAAHPAPEARR